jgi:hypothetical protein
MEIFAPPRPREGHPDAIARRAASKRARKVLLRVPVDLQPIGGTTMPGAGRSILQCSSLGIQQQGSSFFDRRLRIPQ